MNTLLYFFAMASSGQGQQSGNPMGFLLPMILIFVVMYLLIFRPQAKKQKEHQRMLNELKKGDRVLTAGGIYGTIVGIREKEGVVIVKVADNVKLEMARTSIARRLETDSGKS